MKPSRPAVAAAFALSLAACSGDLSIDIAGESAGTLHWIEFPPGQAHEHRLPFRISGGMPPYDTRIEGCPGWATLLPDQGTLAGTAPLGDSGETYFCTYVVTDSGTPPESRSYGLRLAVGSPASPVALPFADVPRRIALHVDHYHSRELPPASGGNAPYTYSLTCAGGILPPGMSFAPATRMFAGTPGAPFRDSCTYLVTDSSQPPDVVSAAIEIAVGPRRPLALPSAYVPPLNIGFYRSVQLPAASGGIEPHTYSLTCAGGMLPSGMGFAPATRVFAGTPDAPFRDSCTYSVTDSSQPPDAVSAAIEITVGPRRPLALPSANVPALIVNLYRSVQLPAATGGVEPYTYSLTCAGGTLPSGMGFAPATRVFAGTPDAPFRDSCTYSVTDSSQPPDVVSAAIEIAVGPRRPLALPSAYVPPLNIGFYRSVQLPAASGGIEPHTYSLTCAGGTLPSGMGFAPATRMFAGTPGAVFRDSCTYSVTDSSRPPDVVSRPIEIAVGPRRPFALPAADVPLLNIGLYHSDPLPAASGGVEPYTYSLTCAGGALPSGMGFAPATRVFAGTPGAVFRDSCTYSATDSSQPAATVSVAVEVEVSGATPPLNLEHVFESDPEMEELTLKIGRRSQTSFQFATGGIEPHTYELLDCALPAGLEFHSSTRILSGTPGAEYRGPNCTYRVTDSSSPPESLSLSFVLVVEPLEDDTWRFRTRTVAPGGPCAQPGGGSVDVATMPAAHAGEGTASYALPGAPNPPDSGSLLSFDPSNRVLAYRNPDPPPVLGTPNTYRYLVGTADSVDAENADDALCLDVQYVRRSSSCEETPPLTHIQIVLEMRDDAFWDENAGEYRCPDTTAPAPRSPGAQGVSNPVHTALAPVHARRAVDVAHEAIRDRVRGWSPAAPGLLTAFAPAVGLASLSGSSGGFSYSGSSESLSAGAELGAGSWQAGLLASVTSTDLHYRAAEVLAEHGYRAGEHDTEIVSLHPFAAWHIPSGGHFWASLGAGTGHLRHRDDLGFPSWSRSDIHLRAYAAGGSVPVADVLSGELQAEAGIESFAFEIAGGGRISSSLPTMRGRDYRAGLAWSAPIAGAPSLSVAYKHLTGHGPEGGQLEAKGSVSVEGLFDPRLTVIGSAEGSFGLGDNEHETWGLGGGIRFAAGPRDRGFGLDLDTRLVSLDDGGSSDFGIRGEAGYGLWGGSFYGTVRPYVGLIRHSGDGSLRRALGVSLRDTPDSRVKVEVYDEPRHRFRALWLTLRRLF